MRTASKKYKLYSGVPALKGTFAEMEDKLCKHIVQIYYKRVKGIKRNAQKTG